MLLPYKYDRLLQEDCLENVHNFSWAQKPENTFIEWFIGCVCNLVGILGNVEDNLAELINEAAILIELPSTSTVSTWKRKASCIENLQHTSLERLQIDDYLHIPQVWQRSME